MDYFRRKADKPRADARAKPPSAGAAPVTHRLTRELARAESLALMLATSRAAAFVDVSDYLAGIYIYDWERLSKFWEDSDAICDYLQRICRISPERWHHWIEFYDKERRGDDRPNPRKFVGSANDGATDRTPLGLSRELAAVLKRAESIAPHRDTFEGRTIPILTTECVLLSIVWDADSEIGRKVLETGLDVARLEQAARHPRHAPLHGDEEK
jgi:hypothetical protein